MYCLDSCTCIDFLRGKAPFVYRLLRESDPQLFRIPAIVEAELRVGAQKSDDPARAHRVLDLFLLPFETIPFDSSCAFVYGRIRAELERQGLSIGRNDLLIAATALANNAVLVTSNVREFKRVSGLMLEEWAEVDLDKEPVRSRPIG